MLAVGYKEPVIRVAASSAVAQINHGEHCLEKDKHQKHVRHLCRTIYKYPDCFIKLHYVGYHPAQRNNSGQNQHNND